MLRAVSRQDGIGKMLACAHLLRRCIRPAMSAFTMFLLMRAEIVPDFAPFAAAFLAAGLSAGLSPAALVLGCLLGMLRLPLREISVISAVGCAGVLAGEIAFSLIPALMRIAPETRASLVAGFGVLLPALAFSAGNMLRSLQSLGCAALACACAPFFLPALRLHINRKRLMAQEKIGAILLTGACLCGLRSIYPPAAIASALFLLQILPSMGASGGIAWGLALMGGGMEMVACLGVCGFVSGLEIYTKRWQRAVALSAAWLIMSFAVENIMPLEAVAASAAAVLMPERWFRRLHSLISPPESDFDPARISRDTAAESAHRLKALGDAFSEMAEGCIQPSAVPDEQELICAMRDRLCTGCGDYENCWAGGDNGAARFLCRLIEDALQRVDAPPGMRVLYSDGEVPPDIQRFCRRGRMIPDRLGLLLRDFAEKRRSEIKRCATGRLLSVQLAQAREILYNLAEKQSKPVCGRKIQTLHAALEAADLDDVRVCAFGSLQPEVQLRRDDGWTQIQAQRAKQAVSRSFGGNFAPELNGNLLRFTPTSRLQAQIGSACQSGVAGQPCGDSHLVENMAGNRIALMLSDGMGSGQAAANESGETLRLLWRFLDAGISRALALETVNQQMLMRTGDEIFATVDLCLLDLNAGTAEISKLAACRTLILRDGEILRVEGGRLPLGILERVQSDVKRLRLRPGDVIVMGSDGVMELGDGMMIDRLARLNAHLPPRQLAEKLVREAAIRRSRGRMDDMTCICVKIEDARQKKSPTMAVEG